MEKILGLGFKYNGEFDEFSVPFGDGMLIIWEKESFSLWELSYVDKEDNQFFIKKGTYEEIFESLKIFIRDKKIDDLLD